MLDKSSNYNLIFPYYNLLSNFRPIVITIENLWVIVYNRTKLTGFREQIMQKMKILMTLVLIGAVIGGILGAAANYSGAKTLEYTATYNFPGADESRINKNLEEHPNIPAYTQQNTVLGGAFFGLLLGVLIGLITNYLRAEAAYIVSAVAGFLLSGFVVCPYPFYKFLPPVAHKYAIWVIIPGVIISVLISIFLERFKPAVPEPVSVPLTQQQNQQQQGKKKKK